MDGQRYRALSDWDRALVAIAVLLDGHEAAGYLENDINNGIALKRSSLDLAEMEPELRMPYIGSMLRGALTDLQRG